MATETTTKRTTRRTATARKTATKSTLVESTTSEPSVTQAKQVRRVEPTTMVRVISNCVNPLVYSSKRTNGMVIEWDTYGSENFMDVAELIAMRGSDRRFYEDNWIVFEDSDGFTAQELYKAVGVNRYYMFAISPKELDKVFEKNPTEIREIISKCSKGMKETIHERAKLLRDAGRLDSYVKVKAVCDALGLETL
jgi:hypothetical protein